MEVTIQEAASILRISPSTIRRRISEGSIQAQERRTVHGLIWYVELPEKSGSNSPITSLAKADVYQEPQDGGNEYARELVDSLRKQVRIQADLLAAKDRQIQQLQVLLQQAIFASSGRLRWHLW